MTTPSKKNSQDQIPSPSPGTLYKQQYSGYGDEARQAALTKELQGVRAINVAIEGVIGTLERAKDNMKTVSKTVENASNLLNTWSRILSQTEHNQRLILNPEWKGATQDVVDIETEAIEKQQAARQQAAEQERRREEARRKQEEEDFQRQAATNTRGARGTRGTRSRGRGPGRGASMSAARGGVGIGRATGNSLYGRARGPIR